MNTALQPAPVEFTPAIRAALSGACDTLPGWAASAVEACDNGDEWAAIGRPGEVEATAFVVAETGGRAAVWDRNSVVVGTVVDPDALVTLLGDFLASAHRRG